MTASNLTYTQDRQRLSLYGTSRALSHYLSGWKYSCRRQDQDVFAGHFHTITQMQNRRSDRCTYLAARENEWICVLDGAYLGLSETQIGRRVGQLTRFLSFALVLGFFLFLSRSFFRSFGRYRQARLRQEVEGDRRDRYHYRAIQPCQFLLCISSFHAYHLCRPSKLLYRRGISQSMLLPHTSMTLSLSVIDFVPSSLRHCLAPMLFRSTRCAYKDGESIFLLLLFTYVTRANRFRLQMIVTQFMIAIPSSS